MVAIKSVVFDCDGVLFDSRQANRVYYSTLAREFGRGPLTEEETAFVHTHTVFESVDHIFRETPEVIEAAHQVRERRGYGPFFKLMEPEPGVYDCLEGLKTDYRLAVFTNRADTIAGVLEAHRMTDYFQMVVSCLDVTNPKPDPEGLIKILAAFRLEPEEAAYVGDAPTDAQAALAAGVHFVAYKDCALPDHWLCIDHFDQLKATLESV